MFSHKLLFLLVLSPLCVDAAVAQKARSSASITVAGVVGHRDTNTVMSGVKVTLSGSGVNLIGTTTPNGQFSFSVPPGTYNLSVSKAGYQFSPPALNGDMFSNQWQDFTAEGPTPSPMPTPTPGAPQEAWSSYFDPGLGFNDVNPVMAVDPQGNTIVAAMSFNVANRYGDADITLAKFDRFGALLWNGRIAGLGGAQDAPTDIRTDGAGNIYLTGYVWNGAEPDFDVVTAKYSPAGSQLWLRTYNGTADYYDGGEAVRVDANGNVYVGASSIGNNGGRIDNNIALLKYDANGTLLWEREWDGGDSDGAEELELDASGNAYVMGTSIVQNGGSTSDIITVKWNSNGARQWENRYDSRSLSDDTGYRLELDPAGNVFVMGRIWIRERPEVVLFKLSGQSGLNLWTRNWSRSAGVYDDLGLSLAVDRTGSALVSGQTYYGTSDQNVDVFTVKYGSAGNVLWERIFNGPNRNGFDGDNQVKTDADNNVYVAMSSQGFNNYDLTLVKYTPAGAEVYTHRFDNDNDGDDLFWGWENGPKGSAVTIDGAGNIFMAGHSSRVSTVSGVLTQDIGVVKLASGAAANAVSIAGRVLNYRGGGISGAAVTMNGNGGPVSVVTDATGAYVFSNLTAGTYALTAASEGFSFPTNVVDAFGTVTGADLKALAPKNGTRIKGSR